VDRHGGREESAGDMGGFSIWHLLVVLVVAMLLFGSSRVSEMGKGLGEGIRNFKKGLREDDEDPPPRKKARVVEADAEEEEAPPPKQLVAGATKKKRVIQIEVDEDADEEEIARQIAKKRATVDEKAT
jgi:sec-independent protein translocase protein TatA